GPRRFRQRGLGQGHEGLEGQQLLLLVSDSGGEEGGRRKSIGSTAEQPWRVGPHQPIHEATLLEDGRDEEESGTRWRLCITAGEKASQSLAEHADDRDPFGGWCA